MPNPKSNCRYIVDLTVKSKTIECLKDNVREFLYNLAMRKDFFKNRTQKALKKGNGDKFDYIRMKFFLTTDISKTSTGELQSRRKIFEMHFDGFQMHEPNEFQRCTVRW